MCPQHCSKYCHPDIQNLPPHILSSRDLENVLEFHLNLSLISLCSLSSFYNLLLRLKLLIKETEMIKRNQTEIFSIYLNIVVCLSELLRLKVKVEVNDWIVSLASILKISPCGQECQF